MCGKKLENTRGRSLSPRDRRTQFPLYRCALISDGLYRLTVLARNERVPLFDLDDTLGPRANTCSAAALITSRSPSCRPRFPAILTSSFIVYLHATLNLESCTRNIAW